MGFACPKVCTERTGEGHGAIKGGEEDAVYQEGLDRIGTSLGAATCDGGLGLSCPTVRIVLDEASDHRALRAALLSCG